MTTIDDFQLRAVLWPKGRQYEDFTVGQCFEHHWGRTISAADNTFFTTVTQFHAPLYLNRPYAEAHGHPDIPINPLLVFNTVLGLSVEDLSEAGGPFVGVDDLTYLQPVYPGDTLTARSRTLDLRLTESRPGFGIVTWQTEGINQRGEVVINFRRANLVATRAARAKAAGAPRGDKP